MKEVYSKLYVGTGDDVAKAKEKGMAVISACKDGGDNSHRGLLKYDGMKAPSGPEYLVAERRGHLFLNLIDASDPAFIPDKPIDAAIKFIKENLASEKPVLVHCNHGKSRSPSIALLYLYKEGKLPAEAHRALRTFRQLYPDYDPGTGMTLFVKRKLRELKSQR